MYKLPFSQVPELPAYDENMKRKPFVSEEHIQRHFGVEESRRVLYEDRKERRLQPALPPKPKTRESIERDITMRLAFITHGLQNLNQTAY